MTDQIVLIPQSLPEKRELLEDLEKQLEELNKNKTKENEADRSQLGDFINILKQNIKRHEEQVRKHFRSRMN